jgi:hypothetical protein
MDFIRRWREMDDAQKIEALHHGLGTFADKIDAAMKKQQEQDQALHERLRKIERTLSGRG